MASIGAHPCFWLVAVLFSVYYGVRGTIIVVNGEEKAHRENENDEGKKKTYKRWPQWQRVFVHYTQGFIFNFVGGLVGFIAISLAAQIYERAGSPHQFESGTAILLAFLALVGIAGVTGTLPELLYLGRLGPK
jgi:hypothetical protein